MVLEVLGWSRRVWEGPGRFRRVWRYGMVWEGLGGSAKVQEGLEGYGRVGEGLGGSRRVKEGLEVWEGLGGWGGAQKGPLGLLGLEVSWRVREDP